MSGTVRAETLGKLREALARAQNNPTFAEIVEPRDAVFARYQPVFSVEHAPELTEEEVRSFLLLENNHHWSGLHRHGSRMCSDMAKMRTAVTTLVDQSQRVEERLDKAIEMVSGMGKNIATAILLISQPDCYGVWNNRSEGAMKRLHMWPEFERGESFGKRYVKVNDFLLQAREALQIDLWTLDALWWFLDQSDSEDRDNSMDGTVESHEVSSEQGFGLERHLHEFLRDNWEHTELGAEWAIYSEPGDEEAGYEYPCDVGRIDLLARHKTKQRWLVIELKRNQTSDQTVGQLLRYVGWVTQHLADPGDEVHGMIICRTADTAMKYALSTIQNMELRLYEVQFSLQNPDW